MEEFAGWLVESFVGVGPEEVALRLEEVGGEAGGAVAVVVAEAGGEGGHGNAVKSSERDHFAPVLLGAVEDVLEEGVEHEIHEAGIAAVGVRDAVEEAGADDAAAAPDGSDAAEIEAPVLLFAHGFDEVESLGVADDFRCVEGVVHFLDEGGLVSGEGGGGAVQFRAGGDALLALA